MVRERIPAVLQNTLAHLGQRTAPGEVRRVIRELCEIRPLRADELAELLGRTRPYVVEKYLTPMVASGELFHTHPEQPRHPQQAYSSRPTANADPGDTDSSGLSSGDEP